LDDAIVGTTVNLSSNIGVAVGDGLIQIQYVTISTYNRLLKKIRCRHRSWNHDYYKPLKYNPGADLSNAIQLLVNKLNR